MLEHFANWLAATSASEFIQDVPWIIPLVQTIHILAIAAVLSSVLMIHFRLLGWTARQVTLGDVAYRFLPWVWGGLIALALSGTVLIIGEPVRSLLNPAFQIKMTLLLFAIAATAIFARSVPHVDGFGRPHSPPTPSARLLAVISLALWLAIAVSGRLIAYIGQDV